LDEWKIVNNFKRHEKNVYCLLHFVTPPAATEAVPLLDTFTVVLSDPNLAYQVVPNSRFDFPYKVGVSHDPNIIEVNHPVSNTCAADEELEYTIHFQNTGTNAAHRVVVNLELDPALDPATLKVWQTAIGTQDLLGSANATSSLAPSSPFPSKCIPCFQFQRECKSYHGASCSR
jgi:uncharacterized repeat protein (TIGR01451 family)